MQEVTTVVNNVTTHPSRNLKQIALRMTRMTCQTLQQPSHIMKVLTSCCMSKERTISYFGH